jgi:predicted TIM-barrel fold metal-dependent hydrolase
MEIIDAQLHPNRMGPDWADAEPETLVTATVAAMDAIGVRAALLDEWSGWTSDGRSLPGHDLPNGARRTDYQVSERAVARFPDRFAYYARYDLRDPDLADLMAGLRSHPGRLALRWFPQNGAGGVLRTPAGPVDHDSPDLPGYLRYFALAQKHAIPVFLVVPGQADLLEPFVRRFDELWFVIDHCGVGFPPAGQAGPGRFDGLNAVAALASYPNVALKWCHAPRLSIAGYPYPDVLEWFGKMLEAYGPERIVWASDHTQGLRPDSRVRTFSWAESLYYLLGSGVMSRSEQEWVFGRALRRILRWDPAAQIR